MSFTHSPRLLGVLAAIPLLAVLAGCAATPTAADGATDAPVTITVGTGETTPFNDAITEVAAENGVIIKWQVFSDWTLPNQALVNKETDVNAFQHLAFLSAFNVAQNADLTPVGSTVITTWGLYSDKHDDVASIPDGGTIAIPNDPSNGARALFLLQTAGLIKLKKDVGVYPTIDDITANTKNLTLTPIVAQQLVNTLPDVDAVVVGAVTIDKALSLTKADALILDDPNAASSRPYVNVVAVRAEDADNEVYKKLATFWHDPRVAAALDKESKGNTVIVDIPVEDLRATLADLEKLARSLD